jgi:hypothetical protein
LAATLAVSTFLGLSVLGILAPPTGVTIANFNRIEGKMSCKDVERLFGCPNDPQYNSSILGDHPHDPLLVRIWVAGDGSVA